MVFITISGRLFVGHPRCPSLQQAAGRHAKVMNTDLSNRPKVLFVTAHPDDVAFNMGGTAALLKDDYELHSYCITSGERGYDWDGEGMPPPNQPLADQREAEERASAEMIGAQLRFFHQPDGELFAGEEICREIAALIAELKPVAIFGMGPYEKPDHAACFQITRHALHLSKRFWETEFYTNITIGESHNAFNPNVFVNTESVIDHKKAQCMCHQHHLHDLSYWDMLKSRDEAMGKIACCNYAEAYFSELSLMASRWGRPAPCILMNVADKKKE